MIHRESHDDVTVLRLEHGKANALDTELLGEMNQQLDELETGSSPVVLTGTDTVFSAGVDLFRMLDGDAAYSESFVKSLDAGLRRIFTSPLPIVAAINGHAIAGGCVLAAACDHRVMTDHERRKIGLTELAVGVPFPSTALEIVAPLMSRNTLAQLVLSSEVMAPARALELGLVDVTVPHDEVLSTAIAAARRLGAIPAPAFAITKRQLRQPVLERIDRQEAAFDQDVRAVWQSEEARASMRAFMERTTRK